MANKLRASGQIQDKDRYISISEAKKQMVAMLEEIQDEIFKESWRLECICDDLDGSAVDLDDINKVIQQKINELRGKEECGNIDG